MTDPQLGERLAAVRAGIAEAVRAAGRSDGDVTTIVVTKFHPASLVRDLLSLGVVDFGENRHQEAEAKAEELQGTAARWHFIGQLQSKKARAVARYASVIHSIDRESVVTALDGIDGVRDVFVQVNLTQDPARGGVSPAELEALVERVVAAPTLRLLGVMAVAPLDEAPRAAFARLRGISDRVVAIDAGARSISAGMSQDYAEAIAEGATHLRIGSAITGKRPLER